MGESSGAIEDPLEGWQYVEDMILLALEVSLNNDKKDLRQQV